MNNNERNFDKKCYYKSNIPQVPYSILNSQLSFYSNEHEISSPKLVLLNMQTNPLISKVFEKKLDEKLLEFKKKIYNLEIDIWKLKFKIVDAMSELLEKNKQICEEVCNNFL